MRRQPKGLAFTVVVNWLIKPFTMFFFAWLFLQVIFAPFIEAGLAQEYVAGGRGGVHLTSWCCQYQRHVMAFKVLQQVADAPALAVKA